MTVFILGAGVMQIPAIQTARELGWYVVLADGNASAVAVPQADRFCHVDLKDLDGLEAAARAIRAERGLDAVFTAGTDFSASVAWVAERLGLPGIPWEVARKASDKIKMRAAFDAAGVPSPRFTSVDGAKACLETVRAAGLTLPLVVKPADSMGARGCRLAKSPADLEAAIAAALPHSRSGRAIVEEYMEGPEFSIDAIVVDGRITIRGIADRYIAFSPYFVELGHTMPSSYGREIVDEVCRVFCAGVRALGITRGAAKGDMKWCPERGGAMVGEIAARLSGGYMSGWTYPYASGIEVTREALEVAAGLSPSPAASDRGWVSAEKAFISIPGRVAAVLGLRAAEASPYVKNVFTRVAPGETCVFPSNNVEKCGNVIAQAPDRSSAEAAAEAAIAGILVRLEPANPETEAFLAGRWPASIRNEDGTGWPAEAFSPPEALLEAIRSLPDYLAAPSDSKAPLVLDLPPSFGAADYAEKDWSGRGFLESARLALAIAGAGLIDAGQVEAVSDPAVSGPAGEGRVLGSRFWLALLRGGAQAALYTLDTEAGGGGAA